MKGLIFCSAVLALGLTACGPDTRAERVLWTGGSAAGGKASFDAYCAGCHGADGRGTSRGENIITPAAWYGEVAYLDAIIEGMVGTNMGSYAGLSDQQLADLYAYIRSLPK
jgi:mono/diheme cytochrome c family protein